MSFAIFVDFGAGYTDIAEHCRNLAKMQRLHSDLAPCVNTCSFIVDDPTTANLFLTSATYLPMYVEKDAVAWFVGLVRPTYGAQVSANLDSLSVECVDKSITLQKKIGTSLYYNGFAVCDPDTKAASILHQLFYAAGFADAELDLSLINETITTYAQASSDGASYWDAIAELCREFGYTYDVGDDGIVYLTDLYPTTYTPGLIEDRDIYHSMTIDRQETQTEAVRVTWHPTVTLTNRIVFEDTTGSDGTTGCKIDVAATGYYPEGAGTGDVFCEYQLDGYEILTVLAAELLFNANGVTEDTFTPGYKRALLKLYSAGGGTITQLRIRGNAICRDQQTIYRSVRYNVPASEKVLDVEAKWLSTSTQAQRLSSGLASWYDFADFLYSWPADAALTLGGIYTLEDAVLDISTDVRIVEIKKDEWGELQIAAEGMSAYTVGAVSRDDAVGTSPATAAAKAASEPTYAYDGLGALPYEGWDSIPAGAELFDLRQPDCKSSTMREPTTKEIVFLPGKLRDELGTEYDNLWSKFPGLGTIGVFKATTNLITDPEDLTTANWANNNSTDAASSLSFQGKKFTKIIGDNSAATARMYQSIVVAATPYAIRATFHKGSSTASDANTSFWLYHADAATIRVSILIPWDGSAPVVANGTLISYKWYGDVVEVLAQGAACDAGTGRVYIGMDRAGGGNIPTTDYIYVTAIQLEASAYPTPYTPTSRAAGGLVYPYEWAQTGAIECLVWPRFDKDVATDRVIFDCYGGTGRIHLWYDEGMNRWYFHVTDGVDDVTLASDAVAANVDLWRWWHFKVWWDSVANVWGWNIDGVVEDTSTTALAPLDLLSQLQIGNTPGYSYQADSQITDFVILPTADVSTAHFDRGVPWFDPSERTNATQSVRINRSGIRLHNAGLTITDDFGRLIDISNRTGLLARDAAGTIIHNLPQSPVLPGEFLPAGHHFGKLNATYLSTVTISYTDANTSRAEWSAVDNPSLAGFIPTSIGPITGVWCACSLSHNLAAAKIQAVTGSYTFVVPCFVYNTVPSTLYGAVAGMGSSARVAAVQVSGNLVGIGWFPVFYVGSDPRISWVVRMVFSLMVAASANYYSTAELRVIGITI